MNKAFSRWVLTLIAGLCPTLTLAWDASGHRLIAQIAFDNLNSQAKYRVAQLLDDSHYKNTHSNFLYASTWPDRIRAEGVTAFNSWHYINISFSLDGTPLPPSAKENIVWAIDQAEQTLTSKWASKQLQRMFLRFLIHFVGDIHQPLHCANRVTKQFPLGDAGGNLFLVNDKPYKNLHTLWDASLGYFSQNNQGSGSTLRYWQVERLATRLQKQYPKSSFENKVSDMNVNDWAKESFVLAKQYAYNIKLGDKLSNNYIAQGQMVAIKQMTLAGYRLAYLLNQLFAEK